QYLGYIKGLYIDDPEIEKINLREAKAELKFDSDKSSLFDQLLFWGRFGNGGGGDEAGIPLDIDDLSSAQDLRGYFQARALKEFDPAVPVDGKERWAYLDPARTFQPPVNTDNESRGAFGLDDFAADHVDERASGYDIALSFAGEDRTFVEAVAECLKQNQLTVFYDKDELVYLWGKDLAETLDEIYRQRSRYVVIFISEHYARKMWTNHERQSAFARALQEKREYVLPARFDRTELPGLRPTVSYVDLRGETPETFAYKIVQKIALARPSDNPASGLQEGRVEKHMSHNQPGDTYAWLLSSLQEIAKQDIEKKKQQVADSRPFNFGEALGDKEVGPSKLGTKGFVRDYQRGFVIWHGSGEHARKAFAVYGGICDRFRQMGEDRWNKLGFPIADENDADASPFGSAGRYGLFENGMIVWYSSSNYREQTYAVYGQVAKKYGFLGNTGSYLGFPISEPYLIPGGERCDFEGGAIVFLSANKEIHALRQLLRIDYSDSPLNHDWHQYAGSTDDNCMGIRLGNEMGRSKNYVALNLYWNKAVRYPKNGFRPDEIRERYCGVTIKSLRPGDKIRFYLKVKTSLTHDQFLEFDTDRNSKKLERQENDKVEYWQIPLPAQCTNGDWCTFIIDLYEHVQEGFGRPFKWLECFCFREHVGIGDLIISDSYEAIEEVALNPVRL
ncbi:MAG TPA: TIR domain-containing protein, partial [Blastocatellia bacterium]|nr:TIR domain-containing protein [Blastocatellia bacterium]